MELCDEIVLTSFIAGIEATSKAFTKKPVEIENSLRLQSLEGINQQMQKVFIALRLLSNENISLVQIQCLTGLSQQLIEVIQRLKEDVSGSCAQIKANYLKSNQIGQNTAIKEILEIQEKNKNGVKIEEQSQTRELQVQADQCLTINSCDFKNQADLGNIEQTLASIDKSSQNTSGSYSTSSEDSSTSQQVQIQLSETDSESFESIYSSKKRLVKQKNRKKLSKIECDQFNSEILKKLKAKRKNKENQLQQIHYETSENQKQKISTEKRLNGRKRLRKESSEKELSTPEHQIQNQILSNESKNLPDQRTSNQQFQNQQSANDQIQKFAEGNRNTEAQNNINQEKNSRPQNRAQGSQQQSQEVIEYQVRKKQKIESPKRENTQILNIQKESGCNISNNKEVKVENNSENATEVLYDQSASYSQQNEIKDLKFDKINEGQSQNQPDVQTQILEDIKQQSVDQRNYQQKRLRKTKNEESNQITIGKKSNIKNCLIIDLTETQNEKLRKKCKKNPQSNQEKNSSIVQNQEDQSQRKTLNTLINTSNKPEIQIQKDQEQKKNTTEKQNKLYQVYQQNLIEYFKSKLNFEFERAQQLKSMLGSWFYANSYQKRPQEGNQISQISILRKKENNSRIERKVKNFKCSQCLKQYQNQQQFLLHTKKHKIQEKFLKSSYHENAFQKNNYSQLNEDRIQESSQASSMESKSRQFPEIVIKQSARLKRVHKNSGKVLCQINCQSNKRQYDQQIFSQLLPIKYSFIFHLNSITILFKFYFQTPFIQQNKSYFLIKNFKIYLIIFRFRRQSINLITSRKQNSYNFQKSRLNRKVLDQIWKQINQLYQLVLIQ